jgi:hypothetical protein
MLIVDMSAFKLPGETGEVKQINLPPKCGQPSDTGALYVDGILKWRSK